MNKQKLKPNKICKQKPNENKNEPTMKVKNFYGVVEKSYKRRRGRDEEATNKLILNKSGLNSERSNPL